ncbi:hypothetical protein NXV45_12855 [Phocaeicola vulgatus]|nr:hypothetical protein [Phocaeicola vulgatus]
MICKYYLMIGSDTVDTADNSCIDVSRMIANISDIKTTYTRVDLGVLSVNVAVRWNSLRKPESGSFHYITKTN